MGNLHEFAVVFDLFYFDRVFVCLLLVEPYSSRTMSFCVVPEHCARAARAARSARVKVGTVFPASGPRIPPIAQGTAAP